MLRFANNPDVIFTKILEKAFALMIDELTNDDYEYSKEELIGGKLQYFMAHAKRNFTVETVVPVLHELAKYNRRAGLWEINDYHYLVIHDTLKYFCDLENDFARETSKPILSVKSYRIYELDFEEIIEFYFWDEDFLFEEDTIINLASNGKQQLGISDVVFGIATGLKPHSEELKIKLFKKGPFEPLAPDPMRFKLNSKRYPDFGL